MAQSPPMTGDTVLSASDVLAVRVQNVVKRVRDGATRRTVLDDVSFDVKRGELVIVRGPSGSGKTTLLAIVGAMLSPTSGEVHLDGEPTSRLREAHRAEIRRRKVGFVFQDLQLLDGLTALRNVLLPRVPDGVTKRDGSMASFLAGLGGRLALVPAGVADDGRTCCIETVLTRQRPFGDDAESTAMSFVRGDSGLLRELRLYYEP
ncbi:MAG: ATP-binding cassette domain-containing protein [Myxococcales bacterium]|nr:ATP-binding cassette domain-containing protein [Myxococcales bacterium]